MKRYCTKLANGHVLESSSAHEANNFPNYGDGQTFAIAGKPVTDEQFYSMVRIAVDQAWQKKMETHKRVSVQCGATHFGRVEKWVKR